MAKLPKPGQPVRGSRSGAPIMALFDLLGRRWAMGVTMQSGRSLWEELIARYDRGVAEVDLMARGWAVRQDAAGVWPSAEISDLLRIIDRNKESIAVFEWTRYFWSLSIISNLSGSATAWLSCDMVTRSLQFTYIRMRGCNGKTADFLRFHCS